MWSKGKHSQCQESKSGMESGQKSGKSHSGVRESSLVVKDESHVSEVVDGVESEVRWRQDVTKVRGAEIKLKVNRTSYGITA